MSESVNAFTISLEWILQQRILNAEVIVRMGKVKRARGFDTLHNKEVVRFTVDERYVTDPKETKDMIEKLDEWVEQWNKVEVAKRY